MGVENAIEYDFKSRQTTISTHEDESRKKRRWRIKDAVVQVDEILEKRKRE